MPEHTIAENLTRLQNAKTAIGNAISNAGGTVSQGDGLEEFATDVGTIVPPINTVVEAANTSLEASLGSGSGSSTLITKTITANGEYAAIDDNALGYSSVNINVPASENIYYPVDLSIGATKDIPNNIIICRRNGRFMIIGSYIASVSATDLTLKYPDDLEIGTLAAITGFANIFYSSSRAQERSLNTKSIDTQAKTITLTPIQVLAANTNWTLDIEFNETFT